MMIDEEFLSCTEGSRLTLSSTDFLSGTADEADAADAAAVTALTAQSRKSASPAMMINLMHNHVSCALIWFGTKKPAGIRLIWRKPGNERKQSRIRGLKPEILPEFRKHSGYIPCSRVAVTILKY